MARHTHRETHRTERIGWLRAAVLGANDGIVSTASLLVGVAAAEVGGAEIVTVGMAGLVAGAMSMAAGEYVSVSSQSDAERADIDRERGSGAAFRNAALPGNVYYNFSPDTGTCVWPITTSSVPAGRAACWANQPR